MNKRCVWIDITKAFAIFFIVLGHSLNGAGLWKWLYGFHVPLFIIVSGFLFVKKYDYKKVLINKIKTIMIPYWCVSLLSILIYIFLGNYIVSDENLSFLLCIKGMLWANGETGIMKWNLPLWFLPMFFVLQLVAMFFLDNKKDNKIIIINLFISLIIAVLTYNFDVLTNMPFALETVIYLMPFFILGMLFNNIFKNIKWDKKTCLLIISIVLAFIGTIIILYQDNIDYVSDQYRNYFLFFISATLISFSIMIFSRIFENNLTILSVVGEKSLTILLFHKFPLLLFQHIIPFTRDFYVMNRHFAALVFSLISVAICIIADYICMRLCPFIIGKNGKNSNLKKS